MKKNKPLLKGAIILTMAGFASRILGFLYRIFLSNLIGAEGMGLFQLVSPVFILCVSMSCGGIQIAVSRFVAENNKNRSKCLSLLYASIIMSGVLSIITAVLLYFFSDTVAIKFLNDIYCSKMLKYISFAVPMAAFHSCITGYYLGVKNTAIPAIAQVLEQFFKISSLYIMSLIYTSKNIDINANVAVVSLVISEVAGSFFLFTVIYTTRLNILKSIKNEASSSCKFYSVNKPDSPALLSRPPRTFSNIKQLFSVAYVLTLNKILLTLLQGIEAVLVPFVLMKYGQTRTAALSTFGILTGMSIPVIIFPSAIINSLSMIVMPTVAEANAYGKSNSMKHTTEITTEVTCFCGIFFLGVFLIFGDFIGANIFQQPLAGIYIKNLAWLCPFLYLSISFGSILHGLGKTNAAFIHNLISTVVRIAFLWFLVPTLGITGYFWGLLISNLLTTFLHAIVISTTTDFRFSPWICIIKPTLWLLLSVGVGLFVKDFVTNILSFAALPSLMVSFITTSFCGLLLCLTFAFFVYKHFKTSYQTDSYCK